MLNLSSLVSLANNAASCDVRTNLSAYQLKEITLDLLKRPLVMGVINLSKDSWYRESVCLSSEAAITRAKLLVAAGADIVDIGAESSLSFASRASANLQLERLLPVVRACSQSGILCSIETYIPEVATRCLEAGAAIINLTGPGEADAIYKAVGDHDAGLVICYVEGKNVREVGSLTLNSDPVSPLLPWFEKEIRRASHHGVQKLFLDPGLGFYYSNLEDSSVRIRHQMNVFLSTFRICQLGFPVCHALPHAFENFGEEVRSAEGFFCVLAALGGTKLFRTHEVSKVKAVLNTMALWRE